MAEPSNSRQHHRPSRLKDVQRPPDSDSAAPEVHFEADERETEDNENIDIGQKERALVARCSIKKSTASATPTPKASTMSSWNILVRPASAVAEPFNIFAKPANDRTLSKEDQPKTKPSTQVNTAPAINDTLRHENLNRPVSWSRLPSPMVEACAPDTFPNPPEAPENHDQDRLTHEKPVSTENTRTELVPTKSPDITNESQATPKHTAQAIHRPKRKRSSSNTKKGKRPLLSRPTQPRPPRFGFSAVQANTQVTTVASARLPTLEPRINADLSPLIVEDLAVKTRGGGAAIPDGPLPSEYSSFVDLKAARTDAADGNQAAPNIRAVSSTHPREIERGVQHPYLDAEAEQPVATAKSFVDPHQQSVLGSGGPRGQYSQAKQDAVADSRAREDSTSISDGGVSPHSRASTGLSPTVFQHARYPVQQLPPNNQTDYLTSVDHPNRTMDTHEVLHSISSHSGSIRVTKAHRRTQLAHDLRSRISAANGKQQINPRPTALDMALDVFRTACLADQYQLEDRMTLRENQWNDERSNLQITITEQLETIAEQRVKLKQSEQRFAYLTEKVKSSQKFVSGLQKDHEKLQKVMIATQEQNSQVLQDQIADMLKEKGDLQSTLNEMVDSCAKSQKGMLKTMNDLHIRYTTALTRENNLKGLLDERSAMYVGERDRRTKLEQQLLPSVQGLQSQLDKSSAKLADEVSRLRGSTESREAEGRRHSTTTQECLAILQELRSLPILGLKDVRKVEVLLRSLHRRTEAGFESVAESAESKRHTIKEIRQQTHDQIKALQSDIRRHDQAIADTQLAGGAYQTLMTGVEKEKQNSQQLEQQLADILLSEAVLETQVTDLETETGLLNNTIHEHEAQLRESEVEIARLQEQLRGTKIDLGKSNTMVKQFERRHLEQQRQFSEYRSDAMNRLSRLSEHWRGQTEAKDREYSALQQDTVDLRTELESEQSRNHQLDAELSQRNSTIQALREEKQDAIEKEGGTRDLLRSAENLVLKLKHEEQKISVQLEKALAELHTAKNDEKKLTSNCSELQRQLNQVQDTSRQQLQQERSDNNILLQEAETTYATNTDELKCRLALAEELQEELQAKSAQMEVEHARQIRSNEQEFNANFASFAAQSQLEQEKLKAQYKQQTEISVSDAEAQTINMFLNGDELVKETEKRVADMVAESEKRIKATKLSTITTLVPNTQPEINGEPFYQKSHLERNGATVNRPVSSVKGAGTSRASVSERRRESSEIQVGYFQEQYESRFGPQPPLQNQETQFSLVNPEAEVVPETQDFEYGQGGAAHFDVIESQAIDSGNGNREEDSTDLSTIPSEGLSEMLLDYPRKRPYSPEHVLPLNEELETSRTLAHDMSSDSHSTDSRGRPKSRANTASRMMPLSRQDMQRQSAHTEEDPRGLSRVCAERRMTADDNDASDFVHFNDANHKRTYGRRSTLDIDSSHKRKATGSVDESGLFKKPRTPAQPFVEGPNPASRNFAPYTPAPINTPSRSNNNPNPASVTGRRSGYRKSSTAGSHSAATRLSSTRNTRSQTNRYAERFTDELGRH